MTSVHNNNRFSPAVEQALREAGWYPGRMLPESEVEKWYAFRWKEEPGYCYAHEVALQVLREFGGLHIEQSAPGINYPRKPFCIDPLSALGIHDDHWLFYEWHAEDTLYPLSFVGQERDAVLAMTHRGQVFLLGEVLMRWGDTFDQALENAILGIRPAEVPVPNYKWNAEESFRVRDAIRRLFAAE